MRHGRGVADTLTAQTRAWPTPISGDAHLSSTPEVAQLRLDEGKETLSRVVQALRGDGRGKREWQTVATGPNRKSAKATKPRAEGGHTSPPGLEQQAEAWATPNAGDDRGPFAGLEAAQARHAALGVHKQVGLRDEVPRAAWATATANDAKNNGSESQVGKGDGADNLNVQAGGALNPEWVECLMGWPRGWTSLAPLARVEFSPWPAPPGPQHHWEPPRLAPRVPGRTARLRMLGNGQVPATAVMAWRLLSGKDDR